MKTSGPTNFLKDKLLVAMSGVVRLRFSSHFWKDMVRSNIGKFRKINKRISGRFDYVVSKRSQFIKNRTNNKGNV